jgi:hypothetical protein
MRRTVAAALALTIAGCTRAYAYPTTDHAGRVYPLECRRDLSDVRVPVIYTSEAHMLSVASAAGLHVPDNARLYGLHVQQLGASIIMVDETLRGWVREDVVHHERCHEVAGAWHT